MINLGKRLAYVGLSSPMFFDYENQAQKVASDKRSSPNPILDSPGGLILGYDEIWFLCRSLCPENMRQLPYVKFVDDTDLLKGFKVNLEDLSDLTVECFSQEQIEYHTKAFRQYADYVKAVGVSWVEGVDNHSHGLHVKSLPSMSLSANSMSAKQVLFDLSVIAHMGRNFELVTNSFTQRLLTPMRDIPRTNASLQLINLKFNNLQSAQGPYHPIFDEFRANSYIIDFRKWLSKQQESFSQVEASELQAEVSNILENSQREALMKELSGNPIITSISKIAVGKMIDVFSPQLSLAYKLLPSLGEQMLIESRRWQAFLVDINKK